MLYDVVIIVAGIIGLTKAYQLKKQNADLQACVPNDENALVSHQTSHNSNLIHSGIDYKQESLKVQNYRKVNQQLFQFFQENDISKDIYGKVEKEKGVALSLPGDRQACLPIGRRSRRVKVGEKIKVDSRNG